MTTRRLLKRRPERDRHQPPALPMQTHANASLAVMPVMVIAVVLATLDMLARVPVTSETMQAGLVPNAVPNVMVQVETVPPCVAVPEKSLDPASPATVPPHDDRTGTDWVVPWSRSTDELNSA